MTEERDQEIVVFFVRQDTRCAECGTELGSGSFLRLEKERALCLDCADLGHLEYLPRGNPAVTRRATKRSKLRAVVVQWSRSRKRYERQGILAEAEAIQRAEEESEADAGERARRASLRAVQIDAQDREHIAAFAQAVRDRFPGCPAGEERSIAEHACRKHSGRIGRTAAAKLLDEDAIRLAVAAHIRHHHTGYDDLLMEDGDRASARDEVAGEVDEVLARWRAGGRTAPLT